MQMRVFNAEKTTELFDCDLEKGHLISDKLFIKRHPEEPEIPAVKHREVKNFPNGGASAEWVIDVPAVPAKPAWDEYEDIQIYIPYSEQELARIEICTLKGKLSATDYQAIKYAEGLIPEEEYDTIKAERQSWRDRINELEEIT